MNKVVIIGSGFGALGVAVRLQARGFDVTMLEKNEKVGGHAYQLQKKGYTFDMGPSLITAPDIINGVFKAAGSDMHEHLEMTALDPYYRIYFHDKSYIDYNGDNENMKEQMTRFEPADARNYDRFMEKCRAIYDAVITDGMGSMPFDSLKSMIQFIPRALKLMALLPSYTFVKRYFRHPKNRFTFSFHPLFIGGNPFRSPAVYLMIPYLEKAGGVWFSRGGMYSLVQAYTNLFLKMGGKIETSSPVDEIKVEDGRATGVMANGKFYPADAVISNADVSHTYKQLIDARHRRHWSDRKVDRSKYSMSAFLIYFGVKKQYPQLLHHTLILSERYKELIDDIFDKQILPDDYSMYLHVPSRSDAGMAPQGSESMYVLIPVSNLAGDIDWDKQAQPFAHKVMQFLEEDFGMEGLRENLEVMEIFTPKDFAAQRNSWLGTPWGIEPRLTQTAWFRAHNRSEDVDRLYFVGAGTHPGAGLPGVLLTAEVTEKLVVQDLGEPERKPESILEHSV